MTTYSDSFVFLVSGVHQLSNSGDTISISRNLTVVSGSTFTVNATTFTLGTNLNFTANFSSPTITQPQNASGDGQTLTVQSQQGASGHNGGDLNLVSGTGTTNGIIHLQPGGSTALTVATAGITVPAFSTAGIVHNSSAGLLSSSLIVNADVSATAGIQYSKLNLSGDIVNSDISPSANIDVSKIAPGTSAQLLMSNATPTTTWTTMGGDATIGATGSVTVTQARGLVSATTTVSVSGATAPTVGQVLTATSGTAATWQTPGTGGITQLTGDVNAGAGSGSQASFVTAISGTGGAGGSIPINATTLAFASGQSTPAVNQTAAASTSSGSGSAGQNLTVTAQAGQAATGAAHNGGAGGNFIFSSGAGGTSGSASAGAAGFVDLQVGGNSRLRITDSSTSTTVALNATGQTYTVNQTALSSTSSGSGSTGVSLTVAAQAGQAATGASNNGGAGGPLVITSGAGGTSGSASPGAAGNISLQLGGTELINFSGSTIGNITVTNTTAVPNFAQTALSSTSSGSGSAGKNWTITAQAGQAATGAGNNGGNGGVLTLSSGAGGTSGSATPGTAGNIVLQTGGSNQITVTPTSVTMAAYGTGIAHFGSAGAITSTLIVNADVSATAAIAYSKLNLSTSIVNGDIATAAAIAVSKIAAGTSAQILMSNATPATTWTTLGGDATIGATGTLTVSQASGLRTTGAAVTVSGAAPPSTGQVLTATGATTATWQAPSGAITGSVAYTFTLVNTGTTYTVDSGATKDYYILVNTSSGGSNGLMTITLPAPSNGRTLVIKDIGGAAGTIVSGSFTNSITIARHSSENIENLPASYVISANFLTLRIMSDGTNWWLI